MPGSAESRRTRLLAELFQGYEGPPFSLRLWDGWRWSFGSSAGSGGAGGAGTRFELAIETPKALQALVAEPTELTLGEAFIHGELEIEGDIFGAFALADFVLNRPRGLRQRIVENVASTLFGLGQWIGGGRGILCGETRRRFRITTISLLSFTRRGWGRRWLTPARISEAGRTPWMLLRTRSSI